MGIKKLNTYLQSQCSHNAIARVPLNHFKHKTFVIDTSIYIYKYLSEDTFLESFMTMLAIFRQYQITPIFVFDGKPPAEKDDVLWERYQRRKDAEAKYNTMVTDLDTQELTEDEKRKEIEKMAGLKRQFVRVTDAHLQQLKQLFVNYGVQYIEAPAESDQLCAYLVKHQFADACVSDDMDMFAYECPVIVRKLNLFHHNCLVYRTEVIKEELQLDHFQELLMLCGTDYNTNIGWDMVTTTKRFQFYEDEKLRKQTEETSFYQWLEDHRFIDAEQRTKVTHSYEMFQLPETLEYTMETNLVNDWAVLKAPLEDQGFVFAS